MRTTWKAMALMILGSCLGTTWSQAQVDIEVMEASTVRILTVVDDQFAGTGSGFIVGDGMYVVTNLHVVVHNNRILQSALVVASENVASYADLQWHSVGKDLAILKLQKDIGKKPAVFAPRDTIQKTQTVYALGFPGAADKSQGGVDVEIKVSKGIVSGFVTLENGTSAYQIDAPLNPGNSGGPLFNECGQIIGINALKSLTAIPRVNEQGKTTFQRIPLGEGIAWAILIDELLPALNQRDIDYQLNDEPCSLNSSTPGFLGLGMVPLILIAGFGFMFLLGLGFFLLREQKRERRLREATGGYPVQPTATGPEATAAARAAAQQGNAEEGTYIASPGTGWSVPKTQVVIKTATIKCVEGEFSGMAFLLTHDPFILGRDPNQCDLTFETTASVSKTHCRLFDLHPDQVSIEDLGSSNGTFVSGQRLQSNQPLILKDRDRFQLGGSNTTFEIRLTN